MKHVGRLLTLGSPFEAAGLLSSTLIGLIKTLTVLSCLQVVFQGLLNQCKGQQPEVSLFQYLYSQTHKEKLKAVGLGGGKP